MFWGAVAFPGGRVVRVDLQAIRKFRDEHRVRSAIASEPARITETHVRADAAHGATETEDAG
jgi:hypothetical protein